ncbi:MAG: MFS transporter [Pseudomonadales bacterium]|uniref:MFS transporter n=1 Tax=unclassified Pseudomonas TaxID=196821 RepID=UPI00028883F7|nr:MULTISPECIES: MFS transporter [unclassified Pseudomonas]AMB79271.1 MFS transporter [Pseudomonas fragi]MCB1656256.1 MFS transporter [Pseudomonadales bacterium]AUB75027.1 MFS transporter [Pseudomonas sp. Lz4W]NBG92173.1 MFS transporter [Pseudomonas sp. 9.1(2019)]RUT34157.1 MFS transporter [Pseudomonas sp. PAMC 29040]
MDQRHLPSDQHPQSVPAPQPCARPANTGWAALLSGANGVRSLALAGGVILHAVNVYIATTILPSVVRDIGGIDYYAWNTTLFVAASILGSALSARLLARTGPRGAYISASLVFAAGALICGLAPSMPVMLLGRFIQGLGGGFLFALSYAMIRLVFDESLWPRAMALISGMWGVATLVGPAIGGIFAGFGVWRAAFWSLIPVAALFALLAATVLPGRSADRAPGSPLALAQLLFLTAAVLAVSAGSVSPELSHNILGLGAAVILTALLIRSERRARHRLLPDGAFRISTALGALYATMSLLAVAVTSGEIFVPLFLQVLHHQSALVAGYLAALMGAGWTLGSVASSGASGAGIRRAILAGPILGLVGMLMLAVLMGSPSSGDWLAVMPICLALVAIGLGVGLAWPHLLTRVFQAAPAGEQDLTSASITTVQLFATALGAALAGMVANLAGLTEPGGIAGTMSAAGWLFGVFALAPVIGVFTALRVIRLRPS